MAARNTWITTDIWLDEPFQDCSNKEKLMMFYLMTSPLSNMAGFYKISEDYVSLALGSEYVDFLYEPSKFYKYDAKSKQVLLPNYLRYNKASSKQQYKAIARIVGELKFCDLHKDFLISMNKWCKPEGFSYMSESLMKYTMLLKEKETNERDKFLLDKIISYMDTNYID